MKLTFWGAAGEVTGSRHLVEAGGRRVLLDCGLFQGRRDETFLRNARFGFKPEGVEAVVLSHAHIDHSGALPALGLAGFRGRVHGTLATVDLCGTMLLDSAHIQEKDAEFVNKRHSGGKGRGRVRPLYTTGDAQRILDRFVGHPYGKPFDVAPGFQAVYHDAGHMLGSAAVELRVTDGGAVRQLVFSGDRGRRNLPILRDPAPVPGADFLVMESTYGNRVHPPAEEVELELERILRPVFERRGKVIVPAFAVGRTQDVVYTLNNIFRRGGLPAVPVFVDSPLAVDATAIFNRHPECYDEETRQVLNGPGDPFGFRTMHYVRTVEESKALNERPGPCVIVSASGMAETGRILHHLRNSIGDPRNAVLIVGFQAENTLGRRLQEQQPVVRIFGEEVERRCPVFFMEAFSGHADREDLFAFAAGFRKQKPARLALVHGEPDQQEPLAERLRREGGFPRVDVPRRGETIELP